jgi:hypothetical protein
MVSDVLFSIISVTFIKGCALRTEKWKSHMLKSVYTR